MKKIILGAVGFVGGLISSLYGGWTQSMTTLLLFMSVDWISGIICAGVFGASDKTENGGLSSKVGFRGLSKKCMIMLFVLIGARLDIIINANYIRDAVCIAFMANELLSVIENAGAMGLPIPAVIEKAVETLQNSGGSLEDGKEQRKV